MLKVWKKSRWIVVGLAANALAFGGCISNPQLTDFAGTELSRLTGNFIGQLFLYFVQSISPFAAL
jgi:presenilin-like A22 family membrane protease